MRALVAIALLVGCPLLAGCPRREVAAPASEVPELLRIADQQWERRGELGFEAVEATLYEAYRLEPENPEVLWRLVRFQVSLGIVEEDPRASQYAFAEARAIGMTCLDLDLAFAQERAELGWSEAVALMAPDRAPCGAWTTLAWGRWMTAHGGAAAALDIAPLDALIDQTARLASGDAREVVTWAQGILAGVRPPWEGQDLEKAEQLLARAIRMRPGELYRRVDLIRLVAEPRDDLALAREQAEAILATPADSPEDEAAHAVARAVLAEGLSGEGPLPVEGAVPLPLEAPVPPTEAPAPPPAEPPAPLPVNAPVPEP